MKDVTALYREKVAQLQKVMRELEALRLVAPLLVEEADLPEVMREKKAKQEEKELVLP